MNSNEPSRTGVEYNEPVQINAELSSASMSGLNKVLFGGGLGGGIGILGLILSNILTMSSQVSAIALEQRYVQKQLDTITINITQRQNDIKEYIDLKIEPLKRDIKVLQGK
ncbi:MAG: hypothetical protein KAH77_10405 [Thiomargarita sp.]|nr:hypothetical protein [Thiomargarita sp.]